MNRYRTLLAGAAACAAALGIACRSTGGPAGADREPSTTPAVVASVENAGADCEVPDLPAPGELPEHEALPDPFLKLDGTRLAKRSEWRCRRQEILRQAEKYVYGPKPPRPSEVTGSVTRERVSVAVAHGGKRAQFHAEVVLPSQGNGPFPAIINVGKRSGFGGMRLGESLVLDRGVAIIFYDQYDLGKEGKPEASRGLPNPGLFYDLYGSDHPAGLLTAWAWGASRIVDVLEQAGGDIIDASRIGVTGCSRSGKGALAVGAFDERIALTIAQETSTAGVPAYRIVDSTDGAERTNHNFFGLNWLADDFRPFVEHATRLPIDSHEVIALLAPRGLLVLDNPHIRQFGAAASHTAVLAGLEVYRALGVPDNVSYVSDVANEKHCAAGKPEYTEALLQSIGRFLKRDRASASILRVGATGVGDAARWIRWQTPALADDLGRP